MQFYRNEGDIFVCNQSSLKAVILTLEVLSHIPYVTEYLLYLFFLGSLRFRIPTT